MTGRQLDAYQTSGTSATRRRRRNFRREHRTAYNQWRKQTAYMEEHAFYVRYHPTTRRCRLVAVPKIPDGEEARQRVQQHIDAILLDYIRQVEAGTWPTGSLQVTDEFRDGEPDDGLPITIEVLADPLDFKGKDVNSIERALDRLAATTGSADCDDTDLPMRPIWEASKFAWAGDAGWRLGEYDPADGWVRNIDRRTKKVARIEKALNIHDEQKRLGTLYELLGAFSIDGDPGFMSLVLEWVCDREPRYQLYCVARAARMQQRRCHEKSPKTPRNLIPAEPYVVEGEDAPPPLAIPA